MEQEGRHIVCGGTTSSLVGRYLGRPVTTSLRYYDPAIPPIGEIEGLDPSVRDYEPRSALDGGADGLDFYRAIAARWGAALRLGGALLFEVGIGQAGDVGAILAQNQFEQIQTFQDTQGIGRVVEGVLNS